MNASRPISSSNWSVEENVVFLVECALLFDAHQRNDVFCEVSNRFKWFCRGLVSFSRRPQGVHQEHCWPLPEFVLTFHDMVQRKKWKSLNVYPMWVSILFLSCCEKAMGEGGKSLTALLSFLVRILLHRNPFWKPVILSIPFAWLTGIATFSSRSWFLERRLRKPKKPSVEACPSHVGNFLPLVQNKRLEFSEREKR